MDPRLKKLKTMAQAWGGDIVGVSDAKWDALAHGDDLHGAPFSSNNLGILWEKKQIVYSGEVLWQEVIHEMGHVFACLSDPEKSDEFGFFGWEYAVAKLIRGAMSWIETQDTYTIGVLHIDGRRIGDSSCCFGDLSFANQSRVVKNRVQIARSLGLLDDNLKPLAIR